MSEKYTGLPVNFLVGYSGRPGYRTATGEFEYFENYPDAAGKCIRCPLLTYADKMFSTSF